MFHDFFPLCFNNYSMQNKVYIIVFLFQMNHPIFKKLINQLITVNYNQLTFLNEYTNQLRFNKLYGSIQKVNGKIIIHRPKLSLNLWRSILYI